MKLEDIVAVTDGGLLVPSPLDLDLRYGFASDLMSDVLHYAQPQTLLITGLTNLQSVRTAEMADLPAILFARGKCPSLDTLELARQVGIAVVSSPYTLYKVCGLLFRAGLAKANLEGVTLLSTARPTFHVVGKLWEMGLRAE